MGVQAMNSRPPPRRPGRLRPRRGLPRAALARRRGMRSEHFAISDLDRPRRARSPLAPARRLRRRRPPCPPSARRPPPPGGTRRVDRAGCCGSTATSPTATTGSGPSHLVRRSLSLRAAAAPTPTGRWPAPLGPDAPRARQPPSWPSRLHGDRRPRRRPHPRPRHAEPQALAARPVELSWFDDGAVVELERCPRRAARSCPSAPAAPRRGRAARPARRPAAGHPAHASTSPSSSVPPLNRDRKVSCPFHDDRTPSLHAYGRGLGWRCFGCGACGSIFDLAALWGLRTRGRDFRELRRRLAETFDVPDGPPRRPVAWRGLDRGARCGGRCGAGAP